MKARLGVLGPRARRALEISAEVHLSVGNAIAAEGEDLGIPPSASLAPCHLAGHDHFVPALDQPTELEVLALAGAGQNRTYLVRSSPTSTGLEKVNAPVRSPQREAISAQSETPAPKQ
jgi:hypothetical protein